MRIPTPERRAEIDAEIRRIRREMAGMTPAEMIARRESRAAMNTMFRPRSWAEHGVEKDAEGF